MTYAVLVQVGERASNPMSHAGNPGRPELKAGRPTAAQQHLQITLFSGGKFKDIDMGASQNTQ